MDNEIYNDLNKILENQKSFFKKEGSFCWKKMD